MLDHVYLVMTAMKADSAEMPVAFFSVAETFPGLFERDERSSHSAGVCSRQGLRKQENDQRSSHCVSL